MNYAQEDGRAAVGQQHAVFGPWEVVEGRELRGGNRGIIHLRIFSVREPTSSLQSFKVMVPPWCGVSMVNRIGLLANPGDGTTVVAGLNSAKLVSSVWERYP